MKKLYFLKTKKDINMYSNDVAGMLLTFKKLEQKFRDSDLGKL